jgi:predicted RNase H-like HicB family nuclease
VATQSKISRQSLNHGWFRFFFPLTITIQEEATMKAEFTAIIEPAPEGGYWAVCPEISGANGQGETIEETKESLRQAIELVLEDRMADILRGLPADAIQEKVMVG